MEYFIYAGTAAGIALCVRFGIMYTYNKMTEMWVMQTLWGLLLAILPPAAFNLYLAISIGTCVTVPVMSCILLVHMRLVDDWFTTPVNKRCRLSIQFLAWHLISAFSVWYFLL